MSDLCKYIVSIFVISYLILAGIIIYNKQILGIPLFTSDIHVYKKESSISKSLIKDLIAEEVRKIVREMKNSISKMVDEEVKKVVEVRETEVIERVRRGLQVRKMTDEAIEFGMILPLEDRDKPYYVYEISLYDNPTISYNKLKLVIGAYGNLVDASVEVKSIRMFIGASENADDKVLKVAKVLRKKYTFNLVVITDISHGINID